MWQVLVALYEKTGQPEKAARYRDDPAGDPVNWAAAKSRKVLLRKMRMERESVTRGGTVSTRYLTCWRVLRCP